MPCQTKWKDFSKLFFRVCKFRAKLKIEFFRTFLAFSVGHLQRWAPSALGTFSVGRPSASAPSASPPSAAWRSPPSAAWRWPRGTGELSGDPPIVSTPSVAAGSPLATARCAHLHRMCASVLKCRAKVHKHKIIQKTFFCRYLLDKTVFSGPFRCQLPVNGEQVGLPCRLTYIDLRQMTNII